MARRARNPFLGRSFQRALGAMARSALRAGAKVVKKALRSQPAVRTPVAGVRAKSKPVAQPALTQVLRIHAAQWSSGVAAGAAGPRRYRLYQPSGTPGADGVPLMVMLHGCAQDAVAIAASTRMNRIAENAGFMVLYPEQDRLAHAQRCWNWYDTRSGRAQAEAGTIEAAIDQVCRLHAIDSRRVVLAGLSAGAGMAALLAVRRPQRYRALAMHSGIAPGVAQSTATALAAMGGRRKAKPLEPLPADEQLPALLVVQGSSDPVVAAANGAEAARLWAAQAGAKAGPPRNVQRGARYPATVTDYRAKGRLVATHCLVHGLGHAWSGGAAHPYSDPKGPDASRMIWAFAARQFSIKPG